MTTKGIVEGLLLLEKYYDADTAGYNTTAGYKKIIAYSTSRPVSQPDIERLIKLGWYQEDKLGEPDEDGNFHAGQYNPDSSWYCFT